MTLRVYHKMDEIAEEIWDSILAEDDIFHRHNFLSALQVAEVENAEMRFLSFFENDRLMGTSVISVFNIDLSLFSGGHKLIKWVKKIAPGIFRTRICFCGTPLSAGQNHIRCKDPADRKTIVKMTAEFMDEWCAEAKIPVSIFKEFEPGQITASLLNEGYFAAPSLPGTNLSLPFDSINEYLKSLRATYRRQIISGWKKLGSSSPVFVEDYFNSPQNEAHPVFTILKADQLNADQFYDLYNSVMNRSKTRLEALNQIFFREIFYRYKKEVIGLCMVYKGKIICIFILMKTQGKLTFLWTGKESERDELYSYTNMLSALVQYAIKQNYKEIEMGQTSYYPKMRIGSQPYNLQFYYKGRKKWLHNLLRYYSPVIFPEYTLPRVKVSNKNPTVA